MKLLAILLFAVFAVFPARTVTSSTVNDPKELQLTWLNAKVRIPGSVFAKDVPDVSGRLDSEFVRTRLAAIPPGKRIPTVLLFHGCKGYNRATRRYSRLLASLDYAVILPDSFARTYRPQTCDPKRKRRIRGAPIRLVLGMRLSEIRYAAAKVRELSWVDGNNIYLMGHSQGGFAAAAYSGGEFRGRILSGTSCPRGIAAPAEEPVLALYSLADPWLRGTLKGTCARWTEDRKNMVVMEFPGIRHDVSVYPETKQAIRRFLTQHAR